MCEGHTRRWSEQRQKQCYSEFNVKHNCLATLGEGGSSGAGEAKQIKGDVEKGCIHLVLNSYCQRRQDKQDRHNNHRLVWLQLNDILPITITARECRGRPVSRRSHIRKQVVQANGLQTHTQTDSENRSTSQVNTWPCQL